MVKMGEHCSLFLFKKKLKKVLDKLPKVCYNKDNKEREEQRNG